MEQLEVVVAVGDNISYHYYPANSGFGLSGNFTYIEDFETKKRIAYYNSTHVICIRLYSNPLPLQEPQS